MLFIYYKPVNFFLRTILKPFIPLIPKKFHFPINGILNVKINSQTYVKVVVNATSPLGKLLYWQGVEGMEYNSVKVFIELAKESKIFFDIGANVGYYSLVASAVNKEIKVYGFEPMPDANYYYHLNKDVNHFSNITIEELAISNINGDVEFTMVKNPRFKTEKHHLTGDSSLGVHEKKDGLVKIIKVKTSTLDDYVRQNNIGNIDLIKLDAEASEHLILAGAKNVLKNHRPIIQCEIIYNQIENELEKIFIENNYLFFRPLPEGLQQVSVLKDEVRDKAEYYFVPKEKIEKVKKVII
jgi:FkbM family methyltransferase